MLSWAPLWFVSRIYPYKPISKNNPPTHIRQGFIPDAHTKKSAKPGRTSGYDGWTAWRPPTSSRVPMGIGHSLIDLTADHDPEWVRKRELTKWLLPTIGCNRFGTFHFT
ncbi:hypothetical protein [Asticcacaulis taihuensis]|uniref:hypothetical protein n=1 Tax=Asticcacaulis taihuensis TaxID=260084 RepID=UPI0026EBC18B|nr:hypothetical protein [Asticcacaulis taihuensis]